MDRPTIIERAFELARTGKYSNSCEIRDALKAEGYDGTRIYGRVLQKQLRQVCVDAKKAAQG
jgi:hypothetical protein